MSSSFSCSNCDKVYKRISAYQKHYSICSIIRRRSCDGDGGDGEDYDKLSSLSKEEMGCILKDILIKYQILEKKVNELSACVSIKKKKIDVIEWLNANKKISISAGGNRLFDFATWISQLKITRNHLEYLFDQSFVKLPSYIILQSKEKEKEKEREKEDYYPICAFTHKDGSLYVYNDDVSSWAHITDDQLKSLISVIRVQINSEFKLWQDEHKEVILKDDTYRDIYLNNISKVMYTTYKTDEELSAKIQRDLYSNLKISISITI